MATLDLRKLFRERCYSGGGDVFSLGGTSAKSTGIAFQAAPRILFNDPDSAAQFDVAGYQADGLRLLA